MSLNIKIIQFLNVVNYKNGSKLRRLTTHSIHTKLFFAVGWFLQKFAYFLKLSLNELISNHVRSHENFKAKSWGDEVHYSTIKNGLASRETH